MFQPECCVQVGESQLVEHLRKFVPEAFNYLDKTEAFLVMFLKLHQCHCALLRVQVLMKPVCGNEVAVM